MMGLFELNFQVTELGLIDYNDFGEILLSYFPFPSKSLTLYVILYKRITCTIYIYYHMYSLP